MGIILIIVYGLNLSSCYDEDNFHRLFSGEKMVNTGNSMFSEGGRFSVASGFFIYEVVKSSEGVYHYTNVATAETPGEVSGAFISLFTGFTFQWNGC